MRTTTNYYVATATLLLVLSAAGQANLITDPGFELASPAWQFVDHAGLTINGSACAYVNAPIHDVSGSVIQTVNTIAGESYNISFYIAANGVAGGHVSVSFGPTVVYSLDYPYGTGGFDYQFNSFTAQATDTSTAFIFSGEHLDGTFFIDNVSVTAIPEPAMHCFFAILIPFIVHSVRNRKCLLNNTQRYA